MIGGRFRAARATGGGIAVVPPRGIRRATLCAAGCIAMVTAVACGGGSNEITVPPSPSPPLGRAGVNIGSPAQTVKATDALQFVPATVTIKVNQIVEWKNTSTVLHTVTFDQQSLTDSALQPGSTWEIQFLKAGSYLYRCTIHAGMQGTVVVTSG